MGISQRGTLKKLIEAARHWAGVDAPNPTTALAVDDGVAQGLRAFGVREEDIAQAKQLSANAAIEEPVFEVHEDVWESWLFFLTVQRQWLFVSVGGGFGIRALRHCMNWTGVESMARMSGTRRALWPQLFADLRVIEEAVMKADAEMVKAT